MENTLTILNIIRERNIPDLDKESFKTKKKQIRKSLNFTPGTI